MRRLLPLLLLIAAFLCFIAGYTIGSKRGPTRVPPPSSFLPIEKSPKKEALTLPKSPTVPAPIELAFPPPPDTDTDHDSHALALLANRAQQRLVTLTDSRGRSILVELMDTTESQLKVRRQSDLRIVQIPVQMLSSEDQTFAAYLWKQKISPALGVNDEQMILDTIFGGF